MKRLILMLTTLFAFCVGFAAEVTEDMALAVARNWMSDNPEMSVGMGYVTKAVAEKNAEGKLLWWVVETSGGGAIITAPETRVEPVVSVLQTYSGSITANNPLRALLERDIKARLAMIAAEDAKNNTSKLRLAVASASSEDGDDEELTPLQASMEKSEAKWAKLAASRALLRSVSGETIRGDDNPSKVYWIADGFEKEGKFTHWNQAWIAAGTYLGMTNTMFNVYNKYAPLQDGESTYGGCIATAMAAIMQFYNVTNGPGEYEAEVAEAGVDGDGNPVLATNYVFKSKSAEFVSYIGNEDRQTTNLTSIAGPYNWDILPVNMGGKAETNGTLSAEQIELLSRVTHNAGIMMHMTYDVDGSSSVAAEQLAQVFRMNYGMRDARVVRYPAVGDFDKLIYSQLRCKRPVYLAVEGTAGAHALLGVGFGLDNEGAKYTRIFLGWGGADDAWYCLPEIDCYIDAYGKPSDKTFSIVDYVVTMFGNESQETLALYGQVFNSSENGEVVIRMNDGTAVTNKVDEYGYWSVCVDAAKLERDSVTEECKAYYIENGVEKSVGVFAVGAEALNTANEDLIKEAMDDPELEIDSVEGFYELLQVYDDSNYPKVSYVWIEECCPNNGVLAFDLPGCIYVMNDLSHVMFEDGGREQAKEMAEEQAKALIMVSVQQGSDMAESILAYMESNAGELGKNYVLYVVDSADADADGYPSIGIYDPYVLDEDDEDNWTLYNGQLAYLDQNDFDGLSDAEIIKLLDDFFDLGTTKWIARVSSNKLTITGALDGEVNEIGADLFTKGNGYGVYDGVFGPNDVVTLTAPLFVTNKTDDMTFIHEWAIYEAFGWVVMDSEYNMIASGTGNSASFVMNGTSQDWTLTWLWTPAYVWVEVNLASDSSYKGEISPGSGWYEIGKTASFTVTPKTGYQFGKIMDTGDLPASIFMNGNIISFVPEVSCSFMVAFEKVGSSIGSSMLTVSLDPAAVEIADEVPNLLISGKSLPYDGTKVEIAAGKPFVLTMPQGVVTNSEDNTVWYSVGWAVSVNGGDETINLTESLTAGIANPWSSGSTIEVTWLWEKQEGGGEVEVPEIDPADLEISWDEDMDNINEGANNVLIAKEDLPEGFDEESLSALTNDMSVLNANLPTGWKYGDPALVLTDEGLVANLELDTADLIPQAVEGKAAPLEISIVDGKVVLNGAIENGVAGFWYSLYGSNNIAGPYALVGEPKQASADGRIDISESLNPAESLQFYKIVVTTKDPRIAP